MRQGARQALLLLASAPGGILRSDMRAHGIHEQTMTRLRRLGLVEPANIAGFKGWRLVSDPPDTLRWRR